MKIKIGKQTSVVLLALPIEMMLIDIKIRTGSTALYFFKSIFLFQKWSFGGINYFVLPAKNQHCKKIISLRVKTTRCSRRRFTQQCVKVKEKIANETWRLETEHSFCPTIRKQRWLFYLLAFIIITHTDWTDKAAGSSWFSSSDFCLEDSSSFVWW